MQHVLHRESHNKQDWIPGVTLQGQFIFTDWADQISFALEGSHPFVLASKG